MGEGVIGPVCVEKRVFGGRGVEGVKGVLEASNEVPI